VRPLAPLEPAGVSRFYNPVVGSAEVTAHEAAQAAATADGWLPSKRHLLHLAWRVLIEGGPPVALTIWYLTISATAHHFAVDFTNEFSLAGHHVLHGQSPFPPVTREALGTGSPFVYPAPVALFMVPFALLPVNAAAVLFTAILIACAVLSLYAVGVQDWRCYFVIFLWWPVLSALQTANLTLLLTLGVALVWRYRDRWTLAGYTAGIAVALKLFMWPVVLWLFATRRYTAGLRAVAVAVVLTFASWTVLGFAGLKDYVPTLRLLAKLEEQASYTPLAVALKLGLELELARALGMMIGVATLGLVILLARKRKDDRRSFVLALAACILCSPIVWLHYYALFIVALAILRPRYGVLWVVPFFALGPTRPTGPTWWMLSVMVILAVTLALAMAGQDWKRMPWLKRRTVASSSTA
jgi:Glycosyltransferase family 87